MANTNSSVRKPKRVLFNEILANPTLNDEQKNLIQHEIELLNKKNGGERKPTARQIENEGLAPVILNQLAIIGSPITIADLQKSDAELAKLSNQRITAILTKLVKAEKVVRTEVKGRAHFALPSAED
jgi:hypothetical protein